MIVAGVGHIKIDEEKPFETGQAVVKEALDDLYSRAKRKDVTVKLALVFGYTPSSTKTNLEKLIKGIKDTIGDIPLVGTSSSAEISTKSVMVNSVTCMLLASDVILLGVECGKFDDHTYEGIRKTGKDIVKSAFDGLRKELAGSPIVQAIGPDFLIDNLIDKIDLIWKYLPSGFVLMFPSFPPIVRFSPKPDNLIKGVADYLGPYTPIIGGLPGSGQKPGEKTYVFFNDKVLSEAVACAVFLNLASFGFGIDLGFVPNGKKYRITEVEDTGNHINMGYNVLKIDGIEAPRALYKRSRRYYDMPCPNWLFERMRRYRDQSYEDWIEIAKTPTVTDLDILYFMHPYGFVDRFGELRAIAPYRITEKSLEFGIKLPEDLTIYDLTLGEKCEEIEKNVKESVKRAVKKALTDANIKKEDVDAVLVFSCCLRHWYFDEEDPEVELKAIKAEFKGLDIPIIGFYTHGEINRFPGGRSEFLNHTFSLLLLSKKFKIPLKRKVDGD